MFTVFLSVSPTSVNLTTLLCLVPGYLLTAVKTPNKTKYELYNMNLSTLVHWNWPPGSLQGLQQSKIGSIPSGLQLNMKPTKAKIFISQGWYLSRQSRKTSAGSIIFQKNTEFLALSEWFPHPVHNFMHFLCKFWHLLWFFSFVPQK